jgi:4-hydroxy-2-oxoheptanedioate aldolase
MIETRGALANLDAILAVDGLDAVYIGPSDLSLALGCQPRFDQDDPTVLEAILDIGRRARAAGRIAGIHNGYPPYAKRMIAAGFNFVTVGTDTMFLADGSRSMLTELREGAGGTSGTSAGY